MGSHSDVLVVGGGVIGLACAHYLARDGRSVQVIEKETVGTGASHGNCGLIFISHLMPLCSPGVIRHELMRMFRRGSPLYVHPSPSLTRLVWLARFAAKCNPQHVRHAVRARADILQYSDALFQELFGPEGIEGQYERKGILLVFHSRRAMEDYGKTLRRLERFGIEAAAYRGEQAAELEPALRDDLYGAWHHPHDAHLRPDVFMQAWKKELVAADVRFEEDCAFQRFVSDRPAAVEVETSRGNFTADACVIAAGAWTPAVVRDLPVRLPMQAGKGYSITFGPTAGCPQIPCILEERGVAVTPFHDGWRIGGTMEFSGHNLRLVAKRLQNLKDAAREYLKQPPADPDEEQWTGLRPMMFDDLPVIDRIPGRGQRFVATGHGMMGVSLAPATGRIVADLLAGRTPQIDITPFGLQRLQ